MFYHISHVRSKKYDAAAKKLESICQKLGVKAMYMGQTLKFNGEFGATNA